MSLKLLFWDRLSVVTDEYLAMEAVRRGDGTVHQRGEELLVGRCASVSRDKQRGLIIGMQRRKLTTCPDAEVTPVQGSAVSVGQFLEDVADHGARLLDPPGRKAIVPQRLGGTARPRRRG
ncbi:hypothetical protein ACWCPT_08610 [Streptomyces sp. NPDC002308]